MLSVRTVHYNQVATGAQTEVQYNAHQAAHSNYQNHALPDAYNSINND